MTATVYDFNDARGPMPEGFRAMPYNIEAEQAVLGAILINNEAYEGVRDFLKPEHFYEPVHRRIFQAMGTLIDSGRGADHVTLQPAFYADEALKDLDGARYLGRLAGAAESIIVAKDYALHVLDLAAKRSLIEIGKQLTHAAFEPGTGMEWPELAAKAKRHIEDLEKAASTTVGWKGIRDILESLALQIEAPPRHIQTGIRQLDADLGGGLLGGRVYGIEAPAKHFKTGVLATIVRNLLHDAIPFLYVMADRTVEEAIARIAAYDLQMNSREFDKGSDPFTANAVRSLAYADCAMIAQEPSISFARLKALFGHAVQNGAKGVILDYWQRVDGTEGPGDSKPAALARVADWIKGSAIEHDVWWIVASQQNRDGDTLWSGELERACVWLGKIRQVEKDKHWGKELCLYIDIPLRTHGSGKSIGTEDMPAWIIDEKGPLLAPWMPAR